jgi:hypothetical protein
MSKRNIFLLGLVSALSIAVYLAASTSMAGSGFPLDDAWIHQTYARSLAQGQGWSFIPGQPSAGLTAPLWALLLSLGHLLGLGPYPVTFLFGWLILWGVSFAASFGMLKLAPDRPKWALGAGLLMALEWHLVWAAASGMETLLYALIALCTIIWLLYISELDQPSLGHWLGLGALIGLSAWVRPEGVTLLGPAAWVVLFSRKDRASRFRSGGLVLLGFALLFGLYLWFNRGLAGAWWPNTFYAKQAEYAVLQELPLIKRLLQQFSLPLVGVGVVLLPGFVLILYQAWREKRWAALGGGLWALGHLTLYAVRLPVTYQHGRYAIPAMPVVFLLGLAGVARAVQINAGGMWPRLLSRVWVVTVVVVAAAFLAVGAKAYARDVAVINTEMVVAAHWLAANTEGSDLIAAHDIGAVGYFAGRPLLDLAGLVSPEVIPFIRDEGQLIAYLDEKGPDYLMTFPGWYPEIVSQAELVYTSGGQVSPGLGGENMAVYLWRTR